MLRTFKSLILDSVLIGLIALCPVQAKSYKVLYYFNGGTDGASPAGPLLLDSSGNLYGTTQNGGGKGCNSLGCGTVFKLAADGTETVLYAFRKSAKANTGAYPVSGVIEDANGNLYGTTQDGGRPGCFNEYGCGTIFKISPRGKKTTVARFDGNNGDDPSSSLIQDQMGNIYGTTQLGGEHGHGTIYKLQPNNVFTTFYSFAGGNDGSDPVSPLLEDSSGNFYGTTTEGGGYDNCDDSGFDCGTIFEISSDGNERVLYAFQGEADGSFPMSNLVTDASGNLYGTTESGGMGCSLDEGCGTIFKLTPDGIKTALYEFKGGDDGAFPGGNLVMDPQGNLFGTASWYGANGNGVIYEMAQNGTFTVLHSFNGDDGSTPNGGLIMSTEGALYGNTSSGGLGACGCGTIFEFRP
ncbi:MAG TPA: choice-of-anchor tandem repeat GloVer-containing protein [Rhizomicrobium sp.]|nr:choice-of-anchor tandem repeat GloVer-containing protein [Rhizomicrobium sp.]